MRWYQLVLLSLLLLLVACSNPQPSTPVSSTDTPSGAEQGYPAPAYPVPDEVTGYPEPSLALPQGPEFTITGPLRTSDTQIQGTGPSNVPVRIVNITQNTDVLAEVTISDDGTFEVPIAGIQVGDVIGLMIGDLQDTRLSPNDFLSGPGYQDLPMIGIVFASEIVTD